MRKLSLVIFVSMISFYGCSKKEDENSLSSTPEPINDMAEPMAKPGEVRIGIDTCDQFLDKYRACLKRLPESIAGPMKDGLEKTEKAWIKDAQKPANKTKLSEACLKLDESTSTSMRAQGCDW